MSSGTSPRSPPRSPGRRATSMLAQPTFADGPGAFLQALATKVQTTNRPGASSGISEVQRVRSQLSSEVQNTHSRQEMKMRQLDSQLSLLQQKIRPQLQNIERQQKFTQDQLDGIRARVQDMIARDVTPLQQKYDQLGMKFDRFLRVDIESKLRPMQDDLRSSRSKLDDLKSSVTNGFQRITETIDDLNAKVESTSKILDTQKSKFDNRMNEIQPKLTDLERQMEELSSQLDGTPQFGVSFQQLEKKLKKTQDGLDYLENEYIPDKIAESSASFVENMGNLNSKCDSALSNIQSELEIIIAANKQAEVERKAAEKNLENLITTSYEIENFLTTIETDTKVRLDNMSRDLDSNIQNIKARLQELTASAEDDDRTQNRIDDSVEELRSFIERELKALREEIRVRSGNNFKAQLSAYSQLSSIRNLLEGEGNIIGHLEAVEKQVDWCISVIQMIDEERVKAQKNAADPINLIARAKNVDERVTDALLRMRRLERSKGAKKAVVDDEEETEPKKKKDKKKAKKKAEEEEDQHEEEEEKKSKKKSKKKAVEEEEEEEDEAPKKKGKKAPKKDDDEEEEDEEEPPKKKSKKPKDEDEEEDDEDEKPKKKKAKKPVEEEEDEDEPPKKKKSKKQRQEEEEEDEDEEDPPKRKRS